MRIDDETRPMVVGIGASAGGVEALQQLFSNMPNNSGLAFVVIQHLSPDYKSLMKDILRRYTDMDIYEAKDGMTLRANSIYLNPPKTNMEISEGGILKLAQMQEGQLHHPIDAFFASLGETEKERAVAVVLSGTGSDGTSGVKRVKENGGFVIAQEPTTAKFDGMPKNVIHTGTTDFICSPEGIVEELLNFSKAPVEIKLKLTDEHLDGDSSLQIHSEEESLARIYTMMKSAGGIDFTYYKRSTILRRIERRMIVTHTKTIGEFADLLSEHPEEVKILVKEILIGVTNFFRDPEYFEKLKEHVIIPLVKNSTEQEVIRVWSAGCSTGEEAYSVAILFKEAMEELNVEREVKIFATDVDIVAVGKAGRGIFTEAIAEDVTQDRLSKYFMKRNTSYHISKEIRRMIIFAAHNMFSDPPFGKLDLIVCRNVMIYFQPVLRRGMFSIFHSALKKGGYLFLGKSETAGEYVTQFKPICPSEKIYVHSGEGKLDSLAPPAVLNIPDVQTGTAKESISGADSGMNTFAKRSYTKFLERHLPASCIVDKDNNVVHFFGSYSDYLFLAPGEASFNFFTMVHPDLKMIASTAINSCREKKGTLTYTDIAVDCADGRKLINLIVESIEEPYGVNEGLIAVLFAPSAGAQEFGKVEKFDVNKTAAQRIADLEYEFNVSQRDLKSTIQRLETVNGELQAANEELLTANEELQSSTEELQSVNEELYTVNTEHQLKLDELTMMTNDMSNFLSSTLIGILFVDSKLNIRKFTEYVGREFQLMEHDIGRHVRIFAHSFPDEEIEEDCQAVLRNLSSIDREVRAMNGRHYTLRIAPYRTMENSIRGLVITIIDSLGSDNRHMRDIEARRTDR